MTAYLLAITTKTMEDVYDQAKQIKDELIALLLKQKAASKFLIAELDNSLADITRAVKRRFDLPSLTAIKANFAIPHIDKQSIIGYNNLHIVFTIDNQVYYLEEYGVNIIRVYDTDPSNERFCRELVSFKRSSEDLEHFICTELGSSIREYNITDLQKIVGVIATLHNLLDGRIESILQYIKKLFTVYGSTDIRQNKQNVRMILLAHQANDGLFGSLPKELICMICEKVLPY